VGADAVLEAVVDGADLELGAFEGAEAALDLGELFVGAHDVGGWECVGAEVGAQDVDAVQRLLGRDLIVLAGEGEALVADLEVEVFFDLVVVGDLADRERYLNARSTLLTLLSLGVVPIINENDTVVTDEIKFGDNDTLGALVTNLIEGDALIILTDQRGLYTADPRKDPDARFVDEAQAGMPDLEQMAGGAGIRMHRGARHHAVGI
jgi:hypothetical protein